MIQAKSVKYKTRLLEETIQDRGFTYLQVAFNVIDGQAFNIHML